MAEKLTDKQQAFVNEYLVDLNATQAAIRAGYSEKTASEMGYENLSKPQIAEAIQKAMQERAGRTEINADYVLGVIKETIERCQGEENFNANGVLKGAELLGKHLKLFTDKVEHSGGVKVELTGIDVFFVESDATKS